MDYHWILTLQWPVDRFGAPADSGAPTAGWCTSTSSGRLPLSPGYTRSQALRDVTAAGMRRAGIAPDSGIPANVLFFALEPDVLTGSES